MGTEHLNGGDERRQTIIAVDPNDEAYVLEQLLANQVLEDSPLLAALVDKYPAYREALGLPGLERKAESIVPATSAVVSNGMSTIGREVRQCFGTPYVLPSDHDPYGPPSTVQEDEDGYPFAQEYRDPDGTPIPIYPVYNPSSAEEGE